MIRLFNLVKGCSVHGFICLSIIALLVCLSSMSARLSDLEKSNHELEFKLNAAAQEFERIQMAAQAVDQIKTEAEKAKRQYEEQIKAANDTIEKIKSESEKLEKAAEETIKSLGLYRNYINDHENVIKEYLSSAENAGRDLEILAGGKADAILMNFLIKCREMDGILTRIGSRDAKKRSHAETLAKIAAEDLRFEFAEYRSKIELCERNLFSALYLGTKISYFQQDLPSLAHIPDDFTDFQRKLFDSRLVDYLTDPKQTITAVLDELLGWAPIIGDPYDWGKLLYDPRYELLLKPRVLELKEFLLSAIASGIRKSNRASEQLTYKLGNPRKLHTRASLYVEYCRLIEN